MSRQVLITGDGSHTIFDDTLNVTYHSRFGAVGESRHIFIENGLNKAIGRFGNSVNILEVGFGTGLNAFLTLAAAEARNIEINYVSLEKWPLEKEEYDKLDYPKQLGLDAATFESLHTCIWEEEVAITPNFKLLKLKADISTYEIAQQPQLVFYDAFAPSAGPEMWESPIFEKIFHAMAPGGLLVTFCAKGSVKRTLRQTGFLVEALPGPPGKREMTRASKPL